MIWTAEQRRTLISLIDRIVPADDFPSASGNGVIEYIDRLLQSDLQHRGDDVRFGLALLNEQAIARHSAPFADLSEPARDELLHAIESDQNAREFFELIIKLTNEGYYTDPGNGSNLRAISWTMIGYDPRLPRVPTPEKWQEGLA
jgi:hypothetical protein